MTCSNICYIFWFSPGEFVDKVISKSPTRHFIIHARKALLSGLSPAENRKIPPLKYVFPSFCIRKHLRWSPIISLERNGHVRDCSALSFIVAIETFVTIRCCTAEFLILISNLG